MKKFISMMLVMASVMFAFSSCSKEEPEEVNPMAGTRWAAEAYFGSLYVIEFDQDGTFSSYIKSDNSRSHFAYGTYTYINDRYNNDIYITFKNDGDSNYKSARVKGNTMSVTYETDFVREYYKY